MSWEGLYASEGQAFWALCVAPLAFLAFRALRPDPRREAGALAAFVATYCLVFAVETLIDPFCNTFLVRRLGWDGSAPATASALLFVLLGDFRVFFLVFGVPRVTRGEGWRPAVAPALLLTFAVPILAYAMYGAGRAWGSGELPGRWLWLAHECIFAALALGLRQLWLPRVADLGAPARRVLQAALRYSAVYYLLWAGADVLILSGIDAGFALRILPNQLYYAFWIPFVWWCWHHREGSPYARGDRGRRS